MNTQTLEELLTLTRKVFGHVKNGYVNADCNNEVSKTQIRKAAETLGRMEATIQIELKKEKQINKERELDRVSVVV